MTSIAPNITGFFTLKCSDMIIKHKEIKSGKIKAINIPIENEKGNIKIKIDHGKIAKTEIKGSKTFKANALAYLKAPGNLNNLEKMILQYMKANPKEVHTKLAHAHKHKHHH